MSHVPDYKRLTYPQLRSFCEVARQGSMKSAAVQMDVAQPTVWKQIRALESSLNVKLIESHRRGTRLTEPGRILLELCSPAVNELATIDKRFAERLQAQRRQLVIATTPRVCHDDISHCLPYFSSACPNVRFVFHEVSGQDVVRLVETGVADLALANIRWSVVQEELGFEDCYMLEPIVAIPRKHPLAGKKQIRMQDLAAHPLLNARDSFPCDTINAELNRHGAYDHPERRVELLFAQTILRYVQLGHGVGLVAKPFGAPRQTTQGVIERPLAGRNPPLVVQAIYRASLTEDPVRTTFIRTLRNELGGIEA